MVTFISIIMVVWSIFHTIKGVPQYYVIKEIVIYTFTKIQATLEVADEPIKCILLKKV